MGHDGTSGETYAVTHRGRTVARIVPEWENDFETWWAEMDRLGAEISKKWPAGVSAEEAVKRRAPRAVSATAVTDRQQWTVIDASVWISRLVVDDVHHDVSRSWIEHYLLAGNGVIAPGHLLAELGGALARRTHDPAFSHAIVERMRHAPNLRWIDIDTTLRDHADQLAVDLRLRGADALYVAVADRLRIPLVTWDRELLSRLQPPIVVSVPRS